MFRFSWALFCQTPFKYAPAMLRENALLKTTASRRQTMSTSKAAVNETITNDDDFGKVWAMAKPFKTIPGPSRLELFMWYLPTGELYMAPMSKFQKYVRNRYGNLVKIPGLFGKRDIIMSFDPKIYEFVFRTEGVWPQRRALEVFEYFRKQVRPDVFGGNGGLIVDQGEPWANMRQAVGAVMLKPKAVTTYVPSVDQVTREFVAKMRTLRDVNGEMPADYNKHLKLWALESVGAISLDRRLGVMNDSRDEKADILIEALNEIFTLLYGFESQPSMWRFYKSKKFLKLMAAFNTLTNVIQEYVNDAVIAMDQLEKNGTVPDGPTEPSVLQKLLRTNRKYAMLTVFDMLSAGVDTTSATCSVLLYQLALNPDKQAKLKDEIFQLLPTIDSPLSAETLQNAPYFRACFKEAMRVQPSISAAMRASGRDILINGYQVPKMTDITMVMMSNDEKYYTDSKKFLPERWLRDSVEPIAPTPDASPFAHLPFGYGPRTCIGRRFVEMEIQILITRILREYRVEWHHGPIEFQESFILIPSSALHYRLLRHEDK